MRPSADSADSHDIDKALLAQLQSRIALLSAVGAPARASEAGPAVRTPLRVPEPLAAVRHKARVYLRWCVAGTLTVPEAHALVVHDIQAARIDADAVAILETVVDDLRGG